LAGRLRNKVSYLLVDHLLFRRVNRTYRALAKQHGWPIQPFRPSVSPNLQMQSLVPAFEYPISDLPPQVHFIGALLPDAPKQFTPPDWWDRVIHGTRPIVLATQGTIATNVDELIRPTLQALATEDVWVIATTGGKPVAELGLDIPSNAFAVPFIPFVTVMPHVDLYITNGGYGGVTVALANGVPIVSAGTTEDKPEVGNRIAYSGVGLNLRTHRPTVEQVRAACREVLSNPAYRSRARSLQHDLAQHDAPTEAADLLEQLARTRQRVVRANSR
ncbi:MAG: nucleotide disphospho-sugar-binding domain-containing protein, partial [Steroidobacteraceae bacterium]